MRVLYFYNWGYFAPVSCGADIIAANHLEYFRRRNWTVDCIVQRTRAREHQEDIFRRTYPWLNSLEVIDIPGAEFSFPKLLMAYEQAAHLPAVRRVLSRPTDLFVTNYAFTAPLIQAVSSTCPRVLEAIDIVSDSFALNEETSTLARDALSPARDAFHFRTEMELYQLFDSVLFINDDEARRASPHHPGHVHYVAPMCPTIDTFDDGHALNHSTQAAADDPVYDLLFVGSDHPPNINGVAWFYENVYSPYLSDRHVKFAIAGKVCSHLQITDPNVTKLGHFDGPLSELYRKAKMVVIPLFQGSGMSIKTMECLGMGRATVTTPVGSRGFPDSPDAFVSIDMLAEPQRTAEVIVDLLESNVKRRRLQVAARDFFDKQFGTDHYFRKMDHVMESIGLANESMGLASCASRAVSLDDRLSQTSESLS